MHSLVWIRVPGLSVVLLLDFGNLIILSFVVTERNHCSHSFRCFLRVPGGVSFLVPRRPGSLAFSDGADRDHRGCLRPAIPHLHVSHHQQLRSHRSDRCGLPHVRRQVCRWVRVDEFPWMWSHAPSHSPSFMCLLSLHEYTNVHPTPSLFVRVRQHPGPGECHVLRGSGGSHDWPHVVSWHDLRLGALDHLQCRVLTSAHWHPLLRCW